MLVGYLATDGKYQPMTLKAKILAALVALGVLTAPVCSMGCSVMPRVMVISEKTLTAGSAALDASLEARIEQCRAKQLPTPEERKACIEPVTRVSDAAEPVIVACVAALRAYWTAKAADDKDGMARAVLALKEAAATLPPEYFKGLQGLL